MDQAVELLILMDCTGSMLPNIEAIREKIREVVAHIVERSGVVVKVGFVGYHDHCDDPNIITHPFSTDIGPFERFLGTVVPQGGHDIPEDVLGGLNACVSMPWTDDDKTKGVIFHIFDAPPHGYQIYHDIHLDDYPAGHPDDPNICDIFRQFKEKRLDYYMMSVDRACSLKKMTDEFKARGEEVGYTVYEREKITDCEEIVDDAGAAVLSSLFPALSPHPVRENRRAAMSRPRQDEFEAVCAIDFGTYGTACAFCLVGNEDDVSVLTWGDNGKKTLTSVLLTRDKTLFDGDEAFGHAAANKYLQQMDYDEKDNHHFFQCFKMKLYEVQEERKNNSVDVEDYIKDARGVSVRASDVITEALRFVVEHATRWIEEEYKIDNMEKIQWVLTVPAIWSQRSRQTMTRAAHAAGVPRRPGCLQIVLEPECAAVVVQDQLGLGAGECYILLDCGGGTIDITCHKVTSDGDVCEIHAPSGGPWGSTYIDNEFLKFLEAYLPEDVWNAMEGESGLKETVLGNFNRSKMNLKLDDDRANVNLYNLAHILTEHFGGGNRAIRAANNHLKNQTYQSKYGEVRGGVTLRRGCNLQLDKKVWKLLFDAAITPLADHVANLLTNENFDDPDVTSANIRAIFVVGGFAESPFLMDVLKTRFETEARQVVQPPNPGVTVVKGAVRYLSSETRIISRVAPMTIGVAIQDRWKPGDPEDRKCSKNGVDFTNGVFFPLLTKGQPITDDMSIQHRFVGVDTAHLLVKLYRSDQAEPPRVVPKSSCATIGPVEFPEEFEHNSEEIILELLVAETQVVVKVHFGEHLEREAPIDWGAQLES